MPTEQYHEPAHELSDSTRTFVRMITSVIEEAEAISWYEQRISVEKDEEAKAIMKKRRTKSSSILEWTWSSSCVKSQPGAR